VSIWTVEFWKDAAERAVKTAAQTTAASVLVTNVPVWDIDWTAGVGIVATATIGSVLTSILSSGIGTPGTASAAYVGLHRKVE